MSTTSKIQCTNCDAVIDLDEAMIRQLAAPLRAGMEAELREKISEQVRVAFARDLDEQVTQRRALEAALAERDDQVKNLRQQEAALLRGRRQLQDEKEDLQRAQERMRDEIRAQERTTADQRAREKAEAEARRADSVHQEELRRLREQHDIQTRQLEDQLARVRRQLEEAQHKSSTSARQQEGITRQELFAEELRHDYPDDLITVTPPGKRGHDITQVVRAGRLECGVILWECKRAVAWSADWPGKLAAEVLRAQARVGIIVSEVLPLGMDRSGRAGDVWACDYDHARDLAAGLREAIITARRVEAADAARAGTAGKVYDYVATGGFEARYKLLQRGMAKLRDEVDQDQRTSEQRWKRQQRIIDQMLHDGIQGIILDIIGIGGDIPPAARVELPDDNPPQLPAA